MDNSQSMPWQEALPYAFEAVLDNNLFVTLPVVKGWPITPDMRSFSARRDEVWLDCPALSHAREARTAHRRYAYDVAQVAHAPMVGWYGPHHRPVAASRGPTGGPIRSRGGPARGARLRCSPWGAAPLWGHLPQRGQ